MAATMSWLDTLMAVWSYTHLSASELRRGMTQASSTHTTSLDHPRWKSWALTEVLYRDHDVLSKAFAVASFLPLVIVMFLAGLASAPCRERRLPALNLLVFLIVSVCVNVTCKACVRSPRPAHPAAGMNYTTVHGMPSDHSQFMAGFTVYLLRRWGQDEKSLSNASASLVPQPRRKEPLKRAARQPSSMPRSLKLFCVTAVLFVGAGRVYNGYHTVGQVLVGWAMGVVLGFMATAHVAQRVLVWLSKTVMLPVMLACTCWTRGVC